MTNFQPQQCTVHHPESIHWYTTVRVLLLHVNPHVRIRTYCKPSPDTTYTQYFFKHFLPPDGRGRKKTLIRRFFEKASVLPALHWETGTVTLSPSAAPMWPPHRQQPAPPTNGEAAKLASSSAGLETPWYHTNLFGLK